MRRVTGTAASHYIYVVEDLKMGSTTSIYDSSRNDVWLTTRVPTYLVVEADGSEALYPSPNEGTAIQCKELNTQLLPLEYELPTGTKIHIDDILLRTHIENGSHTHIECSIELPTPLMQWNRPQGLRFGTRDLDADDYRRIMDRRIFKTTPEGKNVKLDLWLWLWRRNQSWYADTRDVGDIFRQLLDGPELSVHSFRCHKWLSMS